jgi:hypothetical protein
MIDLLQAFVEAFLRIFRKDAGGSRNPVIIAGAVLGVAFFVVIIALVLLGSAWR